MRNVTEEVVGKIKTHVLCSIAVFRKGFQKIVYCKRLCGKLWWSQRGHRWKYNTVHALCVLNMKGYRHKLRIYNTFLFHSHNDYSIATQCYVIRTFPVLLKFIACLEQYKRE